MAVIEQPGPVAEKQRWSIATKNYLFGRPWTPLLWLIPGVFLYLFIAIGPSLATAVLSFTDISGVRGAEVNWIGFENYNDFLFRGLASRDNLAALQRTLVFSLFVTFIQFTLGLILALLLNQKLRGRTVFRTLFFLPVILGAVVQGLMWKLFLYLFIAIGPTLATAVLSFTYISVVRGAEVNWIGF